MRSPVLEVRTTASNEAVSLCTISVSFRDLQYRDQLGRGSEFSSFQTEWRHGHEGLQLLGGIGTEVDLGALKSGMPRPQRNLADVVCCVKRVHRAAVAQDMRRYPLATDRRLARGSGRDMFRQEAAWVAAARWQDVTVFGASDAIGAARTTARRGDSVLHLQLSDRGSAAVWRAVRTGPEGHHRRDHRPAARHRGSGDGVHDDPARLAGGRRARGGLGSRLACRDAGSAAF
jgi:hypothetical protein